MKDKIVRNIAGIAVELKTSTHSSHKCTGCIFLQSVKGCLDATEIERVNSKALCDYHEAIWKEYIVEANKFKRRKL